MASLRPYADPSVPPTVKPPFGAHEIVAVCAVGEAPKIALQRLGNGTIAVESFESRIALLRLQLAVSTDFGATSPLAKVLAFSIAAEESVEPVIDAAYTKLRGHLQGSLQDARRGLTRVAARPTSSDAYGNFDRGIYWARAHRSPVSPCRRCEHSSAASPRLVAG